MVVKILSRLAYIAMWVVIGLAIWFFSATWIFRWWLKEHYWRSRMGGRIINGMAAKSEILSLTSEYPQSNGMDKNESLDDIDPLIVKLEVIAQIASGTTAGKIKRYYFNIEDPSRILETEYTPINTPYVHFAMPRIAWEYRFWVDIYDNQDNIIATSEWERKIWPTIFFAPDSKTPDLPVVVLKIDKPSGKKWDTITFEAVAKTISNEADLSKTTTYSFDFDWDGIYDLVTKDNIAKHVYTVPWTYTPRLKVTYRNLSQVWVWQKVHIE